MAADIDTWLEDFRESWVSGDIEAVLELFADDVEYHETPFKELGGLDELREEWEVVLEQEDVSLELDIYSKEGNRYTVQWSLSYTRNGENNSLKGIYLIELDSDNRCTEFWQYAEMKNN